MLIVEARFYNDIADALLVRRARRARRGRREYDSITVPGALEIPAAVAMALDTRATYDGVVALGCVILGETYHFEIVSNESARGLDGPAHARAHRRSATASSPSTTRSRRKARAGGSVGNKGADAARAASPWRSSSETLEQAK